MKRLITMFVVMATMSFNVMAMSTSSIRNHARFISDRMAYELDLTPMQYDDCYEINYDFIYSVRYIMDDVVRGYSDAIALYYRYLDMRNDDLWYVLNARQYSKFMTLEYFYRPIYSSGSSWNFRIYTIYSNRKFFYFDAPSMFKIYNGGHGRAQNPNGFYINRYQNVQHYSGNNRHISSNTKMTDIRRNDFGTNMKERNNPEQNRMNNYGNKNEKNRTQNPYYQDNSNNKNAPAINNRSSNSSYSSRSNTNSQNVQNNQGSRSSQSGASQQNVQRSNTRSSANQSGTRGRR